MEVQIVKELVPTETVDRTLVIAALVGPLLGAGAGITIGRLTRQIKRCATVGFLSGLLPCVVYGMWRIFNATISGLGLDSMTNLAVQLVIFSATGVALGLAAARIVTSVSRKM